MKIILSLFSVVSIMTATAQAGETHSYVVKGGVCLDGSPFNAAASIPVGTVISGGDTDMEALRNAMKKTNGAAFFMRGDERNLYIPFKSSPDYMYGSHKAPCPNEGWSLLSFEKQ